MNIAIIGGGKMGNEILNSLFDTSHNITIICRSNMDELNIQIEKKLSKMLKRKLISKDVYDTKKSSIKVSSNISDVKNSDIVIETITEDYKLKQTLFCDIEKLVSENCILATNTSSIPLTKIFNNCKIKERCIGLHFFFPVMFNNFVEVNLLNETSEKTIKFITNFIKEDINKEYIIFEPKFNMFLNKIISILVSHTYYMSYTTNLSLSQTENFIKEQILNFGLFETVDAVGLEIIKQSLDNFNTKRYKELFFEFNKPFSYILSIENKIEINLMEQFENYIVSDKKVLYDISIEEFEQSLYGLLFNEISYLMINSTISFELITDAVSDILSFKEHISENLSKLNYEKLNSMFKEFSLKSKFTLYRNYDLSHVLTNINLR